MSGESKKRIMAFVDECRRNAGLPTDDKCNICKKQLGKKYNYDDKTGRRYCLACAGQNEYETDRAEAGSEKPGCPHAAFTVTHRIRTRNCMCEDCLSSFDGVHRRVKVRCDRCGATGVADSSMLGGVCGDIEWNINAEHEPRAVASRAPCSCSASNNEGGK